MVGWTRCIKRWIWEPGTDLEVNGNILVHHANWIIGVPNKLNNMEVVRGKVSQCA